MRWLVPINVHQLNPSYTLCFLAISSEMSSFYTEGFSGQIPGRPETKKPDNPKNRLRSYFSHVHSSSSDISPSENSLRPPSVSVKTEADASIELGIDAILHRMKVRLVKYPDRPLSIQHNSSLLRLLEYSQTLSDQNKELKKMLVVTQQQAYRHEQTGDPLPLEASTSRHCPGCLCVYRPRTFSDTYADTVAGRQRLL